MGNPWTVRRLREICKKVDPDILFLSETKNLHKVVVKKLNCLRLGNIRTVPPHGQSGGGLALLWKNGIDLEVISSCKSYIDTKLVYEGKVSYATFVYGDPDKKRRKQTWDVITALALIRDAPWFVSGDFKDLTGNDEKEGGPSRTEGSFDDFRDFLIAGDLYDIQHLGNFLSWRGKRWGHNVKCRLDRALSNSSWAELYPSGHCEYLRFESSDHRPIVTFFEPLKKKRKGIFRYDRSLSTNTEVRKLIEDTWTEEAQLKVKQKVDKCRSEIIKWSKAQQADIKATLEKLKFQIDNLMSEEDPNETTLKELNEELKRTYLLEEDHWRQRSRQLWLNLGDKNTGYFHASTKARKALNKFSVLEGPDGNPVFSEEDITTTMENYFQDIFKPIEREAGILESIINEAIHPIVSDEVNQELIKIPEAQEIRDALFSIHPGKAQGPDGFSTCFFQSNWHIVGRDMIQDVQEFFYSSQMPEAINETHLRLIPKILSPKKVADYRPLALCNVSYKVISKLLARRLQPLLDNLITETQSAFIPKRALSDNVLITHEFLHYLKKSKAQKHCYMAIKTDMSKAYDRLE